MWLQHVHDEATQRCHKRGRVFGSYRVILHGTAAMVLHPSYLLIASHSWPISPHPLPHWSGARTVKTGPPASVTPRRGTRCTRSCMQEPHRIRGSGSLFVMLVWWRPSECLLLSCQRTNHQTWLTAIRSASNINISAHASRQLTPWCGC